MRRHARRAHAALTIRASTRCCCGTRWRHSTPRYAAALDEQRLSDWVEMFTDDALYVVISRENADRGMPVGLIYCENKGMIHDRAFALEKTAMFAPRYLRHIIGNLQILGEERNGEIQARAPITSCCRCCSIVPTPSCIRSASITTCSAA